MKKIVVIVEDEKSLQHILKDQVRNLGIDLQVEVASNGIWGKEKIRGFVPDLVVLDILLPGKDGMQILREMKEDPKLKKIPVIILTNFENYADVEESRKLGVKDFIIKSDKTLKEVTEIIKSYL